MTAAAPPAFDVVVKKKHPQKTKNKQQQQTLLDYKSQRAERRRERLRQLHLPGPPARPRLPHCASAETLVSGVGLGERGSVLGLGPVSLVCRFELVAVQVR